MSYKALLVDFDGTLAESRGPEDEMLLELGRKYSGVTVERADFEKYWGCGIRTLMVQVLRDKGVEDYENAGSACAAEYFERFDEGTGEVEAHQPVHFQDNRHNPHEE